MSLYYLGIDSLNYCTLTPGTLKIKTFGYDENNFIPNYNINSTFSGDISY